MGSRIFDPFKIALLSGAALLSLATSPACAQSKPSPASESAVAYSPADIVVTGQRRDERLADVPMSIVAISEESVAKSGVVSVHDLNRLAPGVQINFAGCCTQPAIRGITTLTTGVGFENNVAIYVDGFYVPDNLSINGDISNLASIEILKGPQGTLWGRNATGGAILMNTKAPSDVLTGKFEAGYARYDEVSLSGYLSGPVTDKIRFSLSAYNRESDGYYKQLDSTGRVVGNAAPIKQRSARAKLAFDLGENTTATIGANYALASDPRGVIFTVFDHASPLLPAPPARAAQPRTASGTIPSVQRVKLGEGTFKLEHSAGSGKITSYTGYAVRKTKSAYDFDSSPADLIISTADFTQKTIQQTLDFNVTTIEGLNLIVGASYYHDDLKSTNSLGFGPFSGNTRTSIQLNAEAFAGYVDASLNVTDQFVLNVGARYTHEDKRVRFARYSRTTNAVIIAPMDQNVKFDAFTPKASVRYEISPRTNVYASISRGFRTGGFNPNGPDANGQFNPFKPERNTAYEIGLKTANSVFQFETAGFYYDYRDLQVGQTQLLPSGGLINIVSNSPKAKVYGVDALLSAQPVHNLNARIGVAYLHARYGAFANALGTGLNSLTQTNITNQVQDWTDQEMARAPEFSGNAALDYTIEGIAGGKLNLAGNVQFTSSFVPNNPSLYGSTASPAMQKVQRFRQGAYATLNLQASLSDMDDRYKITVYANNVTNKSYKMAYNGSFTGDYAVWSQPVTAGARLGVLF
ncbi:TonB-dependent receptor [Novosphingobium sp. G106]|uniref:TonB-dependent receptor n=1 Tax=Novosphingobium sp. G106 TaxID=2849500 RepID=UPI001C2DEDC4|nr:TonB-dependent receptor [Novosphingobium sp. G106]MBV1686138.1 TonB-dependent receptor [Novosphingobium sp. G106]